MNIIGLHGKKRSGKDTCANFIKKYKGYDIYSLANPIKEAISYATELSIDDLNGVNIDRDNYFIEISLNQFHNMLYYLHMNYESLSLHELITAFSIVEKSDRIYSIRKLMQYLGTDVMVNVRTNYWLSNLINLTKNTIVSDIRQLHEIDFIRKCGKMIFINKDTRLYDDHITERGLIPNDGEIILDNNGTLEDLELNIKKILKEI